MITNYHTHTVRCRHAKGSEEDYIRCAMEAGLQELGFSDHTPYPFKNGYYSKMRMFPEQLGEYVQTLKGLQEKYRGKLDIHIGLETEYYPAYFDELLTWVRDAGIEYMILGMHWLGNEQGERHMYHPFEDEMQLERYVAQATEAMDTGVFSYFAHPDIANFTGDDGFYRRNMRQLIREAVRRDLPLEINLHGLRSGYNYPDRRFWEIAAEEGAKVVLGRDAHDPAEFFERKTEEKMLTMVRQLGLDLLD